MASSNVVIAGTTYPSVPAVTLVKSGGGTATYTDVSDTTAAAADVAQGKYFYTAAGVRTEGTSSGGSVTPPDTPENAVIFYSLKEFTLRTYNGAKNWNGTLQYSTDNSLWSTWDGTTKLTATQSDGWYKLYLRGSSNTYLTAGAGQSNRRWELTGSGITCAGNLNKLLNYSGSATLGNYAFAYLFYQCGNVDFNVTLPATTLATYCYSSMFYDCTSLTTAPSLPATTLATSCYQSMFSNCTSLTTAPALPATTLATYCYYNMFRACTSLTTAPALPATTLDTYCYYNMFYDCISLTTAPALPATTLDTYCYYCMFYGCTSLTTAPALPATTLATYCYYYMFWGCISLTTAPALPATTLATYCYGGMFQGCSKIKMSASKTGEYQTPYRIPRSGTGTTATNALSNMFTSTGGTFTGTPTINTTYYTSNTVIS